MSSRTTPAPNSGDTPTRKRDLGGAERMIDTNLLGAILLIEHLRVQPDAAILNVSSGTGFVPYPASLIYSATKAALHSYTVAIRPLLKDQIDMIEIALPLVQTELLPGQSQNQHAMPLDAFADEVIALLHATPSPAKVCVEQVRYLRDTEVKGHFQEALAMMVELTLKE